jgi:hypothetical protein
MRTQEEYRKILELWEACIPKKRIGIMLNIPRATVRDCIERYGTVNALEKTEFGSELLNYLSNPETSVETLKHQSYAYILGMYLGDGNITKLRNVFRLRITLDARYPQIIEDARAAITVLLPENRVGIVNLMKNGKLSCVDVSSLYKFWPLVLPQHGVGKKHKRTIALEPWQQRIVDAYPLDFWRGLYHSDGSRFSNIVNGKDYPRYQFSNESQDILRIFMNTCDRLGLNYSTKTKRAKGYDYPTDVFVSKRKDVQFLDDHIGPKR